MSVLVDEEVPQLGGLPKLPANWGSLRISCETGKRPTTSKESTLFPDKESELLKRKNFIDYGRRTDDSDKSETF